MTRYRVARIGVPTTDGRRVDALTYRRPILPITANFAGVQTESRGAGIAGRMEFFRVDSESGWVTAWCSVKLAEGYALEADMDLVMIAEGSEVPMVFTSARLCGAHIGNTPAWEGIGDPA